MQVYKLTSLAGTRVFCIRLRACERSSVRACVRACVPFQAEPRTSDEASTCARSTSVVASSSYCTTHLTTQESLSLPLSKAVRNYVDVYVSEVSPSSECHPQLEVTYGRCLIVE